MKKILRKMSCILFAILMIAASVPVSAGAANYPKIPALKISRIYQPREDTQGMCYWSSMATVQAYCLGTYTYGGVTNSYRTVGTDYSFGTAGDAVTKKMKTYSGYANNASNLKNFPVKMTLVQSGLGNNASTYGKIYDQLKQGKPVIVYTGVHASVIIAYNGSTSTLQASGFTVMEIKRWSNTLWYNSADAYNKYANNPQKQGKSTESCYVTLDSWCANVGAITQICYPTNSVSGGSSSNDPSPSFSTNTNSYFSSVTVNNLSETDAQIYATLPSVTYINSSGFYFGTGESDIKKISKSLSGKTDGAGNVQYIYYTLSDWYGKLTPGTKYYYKIYYIKNGIEYTTPGNWFITKGTAPAPVTLTSISVSSMPSKTLYTVGDTLDTTGLILTALYSNGSSIAVESGFSCSPTILDIAGTQTITVTYSGKTTTFNVSVSELPETTTEEPTTEEPTTEAPTTAEPTTEEPTTIEPTTEEPTTDNNEVVDYTPGDINNDGRINASDARIALRISARLETATDKQLMAADVNGDGKVNAADARKILRVSAQLEEM